MEQHPLVLFILHSNNQESIYKIGLSIKVLQTTYAML